MNCRIGAEIVFLSLHELKSTLNEEQWKGSLVLASDILDIPIEKVLKKVAKLESMLERKEDIKRI